MRKTLDIISKFFFRTFCMFTLIVISVCVFGMIFKVVDLSSYLIFSFLAFSALLALSFLVSDFIKNNAVLKNAVRFVLSFACFAAIFFFGGPLTSYANISNTQNKGFAILAVSLVFVVIYVVVGLICILVNFIKNRIYNEKKEYEKMFD